MVMLCRQHTVTDIREARPKVKKFMTKVDKTETKYECKNE